VAITVFAALCFASWLLTTANLNDYHAAWLLLPLMIAIVAAVERLQTRGAFQPQAWLVLGVAAGLTVVSLAFVARNVKDRPYSTVYAADLREFTVKYDLTHATVGGVRDIQWYFEFSRDVLCIASPGFEPEYEILNNEVVPEATLNGRYRLLEKGRGFSLYGNNR
jgi:hypothetical protein